MRNKNWLLLFVISFAGFASRSQQNTQHLTLREAINASVSNNDGARLSELDIKIAEAKFRETNAMMLPAANLSYTGISTNNPLNAFGSKLQQGSITPADFNPELLNNPSATSDFSTKIELLQPLLNLDMLYQRKGATKEIEMYQFISKRTKDYLRFEAEKAYLQLQMAYSENEVLIETLNSSSAIHKVSCDYYNQGLIQKSDLLGSEVQVLNAETQVKNSESAIQDASDLLSLLMGKSLGTIYKIDSIVVNSDMTLDSLKFSEGRADFKAIQKGMESYELVIKSSRMSLFPRLNGFASYQLNDKAMFGFGAKSYLAGIRMSWNLLNGGKVKNTISQLRLEQEKLGMQLDQKKNEAQIEINHARRQLIDATFLMKQQRLAVEQASEALRVLQTRYGQGLAKTSDVLAAQTQLAQQKIAYVQVLFNHNLSAATLQYLTIDK
ncbi:MAG: TolC family protein [Bacteroidetes bacterium]|nr:MAG: TolC family protein [Bacteroidota bacterium]